MNDPAVGSTENQDMLFNRGQYLHGTYHNQYAVGMAKATYAGFQQARPDERPFLLTRSGWIGTSNYAAVWTGDNFSNWHHLKNSIQISLNLAFSGIPFNGPDVPGFGDDADAELACAWYKVGFLFPFLRNHSNKGTREQEPWTFGKRATKIIREFIQLRYALLPYLYQLYCEQAEDGRAIMRPLLHDFTDSERLPLTQVDDQFLVGPHILLAPQVEQGTQQRKVVLPKDAWFDTRTGEWLRGGKVVQAPLNAGSTPMYWRNGSIIPMRMNTAPEEHRTDLSQLSCIYYYAKAALNYFITRMTVIARRTKRVSAPRRILRQRFTMARCLLEAVLHRRP